MVDADLKRLLGDVDGPRMWRHLEEMARWTKEAGTPSELQSLRYIEDEMAGYGFVTERIMHPAYISLPGEARVDCDGETLKCITHSFSRASPAGGLSAELVYVGAGTEEDFRAAETAGRIVLAEGIANPAVSRRASRAGALGQVHISPHEHLHEMCISPVWGSPTHETRADHPSTVVVSVSRESGDALKDRLAAQGRISATLHAKVDTGWRPTPILIAELQGPSGDADEPFVLFTGHHDTWYYGVMDNGGANATMMEVGRLCAVNRTRWRRGLRIAFWSGHSQGRYSSSTWYADANWEELERRAVAHVNVDSTGGKGNTVVADATAATELANIARTALKAQAGQDYTGRRNGRAGDQSFWGIGVPAIFGNMGEQPAGTGANASAAVFGGGARKGAGTGWWWHTPDDLLDKMDQDLLVCHTRIYLHTVWRLVSDAVLPLDYGEHAAMLVGELAAMQAAVGDRFDLSKLTDRAETLGRLAARVAEIGQTADGDTAETINAGLMAVSRALVPVDYSLGDRFGQDPALDQNAYPVLDPVRQLAGTDSGSDEAEFLNVAMMRARNRVGVALRTANEALERTLRAISSDA